MVTTGNNFTEEIRAAIIEANAEITQDINEKKNVKAFLNFLADTPQGKEFDKAVIRNAKMLLMFMYFIFILILLVFRICMLMKHRNYLYPLLGQ